MFPGHPRRPWSPTTARRRDVVTPTFPLRWLAALGLTALILPTAMTQDFAAPATSIAKRRCEDSVVREQAVIEMTRCAVCLVFGRRTATR